MKILFCCQFYAPSVGGVQEVMRQLAERFVSRGHQATVATTQLSIRDFTSLNGVAIKEFNASGNLVSGMFGEIRQYRKFVLEGDFDVVIIMAAQQWTFDALWPILDCIKFAKVFIPCGFSSLYEPAYKKYFQQLPEILEKFDHHIFHATKYRDIDFAREHGIEKISVIPVGACENAFNVNLDPLFRSRYGIQENTFLFLTVGSFTGLKGHIELAKAFALMVLSEGQHATLILNGNDVRLLDNSLGGLYGKFAGLIRTHGFQYASKMVLMKLFGKLGVRHKATLRDVVNQINQSDFNKRVLVTDFPRQELTQAFMAADLFVFASNIEYSPLVLFETAAAGTPFLSVSVGNSPEIAEWTGAGVICPSVKDVKGYTRVDESVLAQSMAELMQQKERLAELGAAGRKNWSEQFTWEKVSLQYEHIFEKLLNDRSSAQ